MSPIAERHHDVGHCQACPKDQHAGAVRDGGKRLLPPRVEAKMPRGSRAVAQRPFEGGRGMRGRYHGCRVGSRRLRRVEGHAEAIVDTVDGLDPPVNLPDRRPGRI